MLPDIHCRENAAGLTGKAQTRKVDVFELQYNETPVRKTSHDIADITGYIVAQ